MGFPRGKGEFQLPAGGWWSRVAEAGVAAVILDSAACPALPFLCSSGAVAPELSIIPFHLWSVWSCPLPQAVWAVCPGTPQSVMILICSSQSGRMSADWERILPRFYFGGLNRKHWTVCGCWVNHCGVTNVGTLPSGHLLSHRCSMCIFYLQEHGPVLLERGVKRKKKEWKYLRSHPLLWHFCWDNSSIPVSKALGYFHFHISRVDYCIFLNWFFTCPAQMGH